MYCTYRYVHLVFQMPDPYVLGPPGSASGSESHKYGSGSGSISRSFPFSQESVEQTELIFAVKLLIQKVSCYKFNFGHQTYFYNLKLLNFIIKHKKRKKVDFFAS
jgi:hypothetical protein